MAPACRTWPVLGLRAGAGRGGGGVARGGCDTALTPDLIVPCAVEGLLYMAPACCMWLVLGVAVVEWPRMAAENALGLIAAKPGLYMMAAAMGFGVNSLAYIVIQLASSLTLKVHSVRTIRLHLRVLCSAAVPAHSACGGSLACTTMQLASSLAHKGSCSDSCFDCPSVKPVYFAVPPTQLKQQ